MGDIRRFFQAPNSGENGLSALRKGPKTPEKKLSKTTADESPIKKTTRLESKKRKSRSKILSSDSDSEDPIPSKLAKKVDKNQSKQTKNAPKPAKTRKTTILYSDSESDKKTSRKYTNIRKSPRKTKNQTKKPPTAPTDVEIAEYSSNSDEEDEKKTKNRKNSRSTKKSAIPADSANSDDDFVTPPKPKNVKNASPVKKSTKKQPTLPNLSKATKNVPKLNPISVADFFGGSKVKKMPAPPIVVELDDPDDADFAETVKNAGKDLCSQTSSVTTRGSAKKTDDRSTSPPKTPKNVKKTENFAKITEKTPKSDEKTRNLTKISEKSPKIVEKTKKLSKVCEKTPKKRTAVQKSSISSPIRKKSKLDEAEKISEEFLEPFVEKYKPKSVKQIIGQQGEKSCMHKLLTWLKNWKSWHFTKTKEKKKGFGVNDDGSIYKAVLLSGSPGIGKTTTAVLCCKELGLNYVELNASDARNKKSMEQHVAESLNCHSIDEYLNEESKKSAENDVRHVLIMDEVDGMSGNEDRAGIGELINLIKKTSVPIICICNDRQAQKIRSLSTHCYDLRVHRPQLAQIRGPMMSVAYKEGLKISGQAMDEIIEGADHDIRQILNHLNLLAVDKEISVGLAKSAAKKATKDTTANIFETTRKLFSHNEETKSMSLIDRAELFFSDYSAIPLFVQENYLNVEQKEKKKLYEKLELISQAAESMAMGDIIDKQIRIGGNWSLLNDQAMFSAVTPVERLKGYVQGMVQFPQWFGKNSKQNRLQRLLQQLQIHTSLKISSNFTSLNLDYIPALRTALARPLAVDADVEEVMSRLEAYDLTKDDMDNILELSQWPNAPEIMSTVPSKVKAALTRAYNKEHLRLPYANTGDFSGKKGKRGKIETAGAAFEMDEEGNLKEVEDDEEAEEETDVVPENTNKSTVAKRGAKTTARGRGSKK